MGNCGALHLCPADGQVMRGADDYRCSICLCTMGGAGTGVTLVQPGIYLSHRTGCMVVLMDSWQTTPESLLAMVLTSPVHHQRQPPQSTAPTS